jgi:hypothetical protein
MMKHRLKTLFTVTFILGSIQSQAAEIFEDAKKIHCSTPGKEVVFTLTLGPHEEVGRRHYRLPVRLDIEGGESYEASLLNGIYHHFLSNRYPVVLTNVKDDSIGMQHHRKEAVFLKIHPRHTSGVLAAMGNVSYFYCR